jgi:hypothetical protein
VLEAERSRLCGARYQHQPERQALRAGHVAQFAGAGWPPGGSEPAARPQYRWPRAGLAELARVEHA